MTRQEAMLVLSALRPDGPETERPEFAEARALVEKDPKLKAWWEAQRQFDRKVAAKLADVQVPEDLREVILASRKIEPFRPTMRYTTWLAAAAVVAFLCVAGVFWRVANFGPVDKSDYAEQVLPALGDDNPSLAMKSSDHNQLVAWLKAQHAPVGPMPVKLASLPSLGCQKYRVHGHMVSLICFALADGIEAHLFTIDRSALNDPPTDGTPGFDNMMGWNVAMWSDDRMSYLLATHSSAEMLKQLLLTDRDPRRREFAGTGGRDFPGNVPFASR